jgi:ParB-like chromosome segregation protein Spo0J
MNPHKLYISSIAVICVLILIVGSAWRDHVRDDARRDAILDTQKSDIATLQQNIVAARNTTQAQIAELERKKDSVGANPSRAAEVIRELVPMQSPIQLTASNSQSPPDAPSATLTKQQEVELAQYALTCKECSVQRDELEQQSKDEQQIISRQKLEIEAAKKSAKGGTVWQRSARIAKWGAIFGGIGYVMGRVQR